MENFDATEAIFPLADTNRDGSVNKNYLQNWISNVKELTSLSNQMSTSGPTFKDNATDRTVGNEDRTSTSQHVLKSNVGEDAPYKSTATFANRNDCSKIGTNNVEQRNEYFSQSTNIIYHDPCPRLLRRAAPEGPITYQQKISVRFLQPPPLPPPGPLIIKEVRPPQPPPPPPLVIRQRASPLPSLPPLILRERPPPLPAPIACQTVIRHLPAISVPPRSVIIEHLPPLPPKPRDIIIERWLRYGPQPKRPTIVQRAAPPKQYPKPRNVVVVYDAVKAHVIRKFERLGVIQQDPQDYVARYGPSLLDSATLVQKARNAGIIEDISPHVVSSNQYNASDSFNGITEANTLDLDLYNEASIHALSSSHATGFEVVQSLHSADVDQVVEHHYNQNYLAPNFVFDGTLSDSVGVTNTELNVGGTNFIAAYANNCR